MVAYGTVALPTVGDSERFVSDPWIRLGSLDVEEDLKSL